MVYRRLLPSESKMYRKLRLACLKEFPNRFCSKYEEQVLRPVLAFEKNIIDEEPNNFIVGAFDGNKLMGICGFVLRQEDMQIGDIFQMYVQQDLQSKGIGSSLLKATIEEASAIPGLQIIELGVLFSTEGDASPFYINNGFKETGIEKVFVIKHGIVYHERLMQIKLHKKTPID